MKIFAISCLISLFSIQLCTAQELDSYFMCHTKEDVVVMLDSLLSKGTRHYELRWVLSIPFFISCIRQQNPLTVLSKIILRKVKQFNLPPPKKNEGFLHF